MPDHGDMMAMVEEGDSEPPFSNLPPLQREQGQPRRNTVLLVCRDKADGTPIQPFCYTRIQRVASSAILTCIAAHLGLGGAKSMVKVIRAYGMLNLHAPIDDCFHFAFVRNPWDRVISRYASATSSRPMPFAEWIKGINEYAGTEPQIEALKYEPDFIGRYENIIEDWAKVQAETGLGDLEHKNQAIREPAYQQYYDEQTKQIVAETYAEEIERFGYTFD